MLDKAYTRNLLTKLTVPSRQLHTSLNSFTVLCKPSWCKTLYMAAQRNMQYAVVPCVMGRTDEASFGRRSSTCACAFTRHIFWQLTRIDRSGGFFFSLPWLHVPCKSRTRGPAPAPRPASAAEGFPHSWRSIGASPSPPPGSAREDQAGDRVLTIINYGSARHSTVLPCAGPKWLMRCISAAKPLRAEPCCGGVGLTRGTGTGQHCKENCG